MRAVRILAVVSALVAASCTGDDDAGPSPTTDPTVPTTVVDRSGISLAGVRGTTTSTVVETGTTAIRGTVTGPNGPVGGATVRIERLVAGREIRNEVPTDGSGAYSLTGQPGGRYRVRAFLPPTLAQLKPEVRFLAAGRDHTFDLRVEQQSGLVVRADVAPEPPLEGRAVNLVALVANRSVGTDGVVRAVPVVGTTVELIGLGRWELRRSGEPPDDDDTASTSTSLGTPTSSSTTSTTAARRAASPVARTDSAGRVRYELRCVSAGDPGLALRIPVTVTPPTNPDGTPGTPQTTTQTVSLDLPACIDPTAVTTTTAASSTSGSTSTTTTTR